MDGSRTGGPLVSVGDEFCDLFHIPSECDFSTRETDSYVSLYNLSWCGSYLFSRALKAA